MQPLAYHNPLAVDFLQGYEQQNFTYPILGPNSNGPLQAVTNMESLLQFSPSLEGNPVRTEDSPPFSVEQPVMSPVISASTLFSASTLAEDSKQLLICLYFDHIQPIFPMFRKPMFHQRFHENQIPESLLNAMFAMSSRFVPTSDVFRVFGKFSTPWENFAKLAHQQSHNRLEENSAICLDDIKTACLLAIHEYTNYPGRKAWMYVGNAVRLSLASRLHQIDIKGNSCGLSDADREEWRFVWWAIWKLDSTINVTAVMPFGIDCHTIGSALVSTTVADFTNGITKQSTGTLLDTDSAKSWRAVREMQSLDPGDGFNIHLLAVSLLRGVSQCQQRLYANSTPEEIARMMALRNTFSCMRLALPAWYFNAAKRPSEQFHSHRHRLETIIMFHTAHLIINEPVRTLGTEQAHRITGDSLSCWQSSITYAEDLAGVFHHWESEYFAVADPVISCAIWHAHCGLTIHKMSFTDDGNSEVATRIDNALDLLSISLENFARWWQIARILQDSLKVFQMWSWVHLDVSKITEVVAQIRRAINPDSVEPGVVDVSLICSSIPDDTLDGNEENRVWTTDILE
ncbi:hypothetical protein VE01_03177 [Pseudogymnoascus verrucosus]|uniref:Xylanolytic transcriptional activator regulatory domain-containing protein n=1 Tax=Pseudogymnoascus verrucosus TaxID=342668 RepID=A0A1B8GR68_9PEZI|nr:uncharacterized protein VE01_03177 [Pseudogymnoascus verrucosus]OBT98323.2 hypothetical protein VE01_03177 [Pseudogymnoascus verrucosus]